MRSINLHREKIFTRSRRLIFLTLIYLETLIIIYKIRRFLEYRHSMIVRLTEHSLHLVLAMQACIASSLHCLPGDHNPLENKVS